MTPPIPPRPVFVTSLRLEWPADLRNMLCGEQTLRDALTAVHAELTRERFWRVRVYPALTSKGKLTKAAALVQMARLDYALVMLRVLISQIPDQSDLFTALDALTAP